MSTCLHTQSFSQVQLFAILWTIAYQAPLSLGYPMQEYWSRLPFPSPGDFSWPRDPTRVSYISYMGRWILYHWVTWEAVINDLVINGCYAGLNLTGSLCSITNCHHTFFVKGLFPSHGFNNTFPSVSAPGRGNNWKKIFIINMAKVWFSQ